MEISLLYGAFECQKGALKFYYYYYWFISLLLTSSLQEEQFAGILKDLRELSDACNSEKNNMQHPENPHIISKETVWLVLFLVAIVDQFSVWIQRPGKRVDLRTAKYLLFVFFFYRFPCQHTVAESESCTYVISLFLHQICFPCTPDNNG